MWPPLTFIFALTPQSPAAPRDSRSSTPATATIRGRITDRESGRPIPGVVVTADGADAASDDSPALEIVLSAHGPSVSGRAVDDGTNCDLFARLAKVAERVTLTENEERSLDLRVVHIR
jgi:hypothetical protein